MEAFDPDTYRLYQQLLFGDTQAGTSREEEAAAEAEAEAAFFQFQSPQAPMLGGVGDQMVINPAGFVDGGGSTLPPLQMPGGGGICAGNGDGFVPGGGNWAGNGDEFIQGGGSWAGNGDRFIPGGGNWAGNGDGFIPGGGNWAGNGGGFIPGGGNWAGNGDGFIPDGGSWAGNGDGFIQGGGSWTGNGDGFVPGGGGWAVNGGLQATGEAWAPAPAEDPLMQFGGEQLMHGGGVPILPGSMQELLMSDADLSEFVSNDEVVNSLLMSGYLNPLVTNQPASDSLGPTQVNAGSPEMMPQMSAMDYPQPQADVPQAVVVPDDNETAELAQMVRVAEECGDEAASTTWSEEEDQLLLQGLSQFADQDSITKCFNIAFGLPKKTVIDVANRIRWLSELEKMKKAAKQAEARPEIPARRKITKGKGTKGASKKNNKYPLSKEALDSKSAKAITKENDRLLDKIEKMLQTGQAKDCPEYFYYVKTNMDALHNKVSGLASVMEGLTVDDKEWADVFKDRNSSAAKGTATTPP